MKILPVYPLRYKMGSKEHWSPKYKFLHYVMHFKLLNFISKGDCDVLPSRVNSLIESLLFCSYVIIHFSLLSIKLTRKFNQNYSNYLIWPFGFETLKWNFSGRELLKRFLFSLPGNPQYLWVNRLRGNFMRTGISDFIEIRSKLIISLSHGIQM
ncbi:hypothetical protein AMTRI_Chr02g265600 [Amborella trichopoda]